MKFDISEEIIENISNIIFHQNPSSGSRVVPCERTDRQTKLTVAFRESFYEANLCDKYGRLTTQAMMLPTQRFASNWLQEVGVT
jgi:hypothetical protein